MNTTINLVDDYRPGGIRSLLEDMAPEFLSPNIDWRVIECDSTALPAMPAETNTFVVHYSMAWRKLPSLLFLRLRHPRARIIIVEHHYTQGFDEKPETRSRRLRIMLKQAYRLADYVVAVSKAQQAWILRNRLVSKEKLINISACRNYAKFLQLPLPSSDNEQVVIGAIGRLAPAKGFDVLIDALDHLPANRYRLLIAGSGDEEAYLRSKAAGRANIEFVGHVDDPTKFMSRCDVLAVPSRQEAFGLVCSEAKAAGRPVVVSRVDGLPEQAAQCGEIVEPNQPAALAAAIARISEPNTHSLLSNRARESVRDAWPNFIHQWSQLLA